LLGPFHSDLTENPHLSGTGYGKAWSRVTHILNRHPNNARIILRACFENGDAGKKASGRKRHIAVDSLGLLLAIMVTPASVQDRDAAKSLIGLLLAMYVRVQIIWPDGGYLGTLVQWVKQLRPFGKLRLEIIRRSDRAKRFTPLPKRWIVERTFGWFTKSRRLCRDYEVRLDHSESMIRICMIRLIVRRLAKTA
jgi:transposase